MIWDKRKELNLENLAEVYGDEEVAQSILDSAEKHKTTSRIQSGDLTLPDPHDAHEYHDRKVMTEKGIDPETQALLLSKPHLHAAFKDMDKRLSALEGSRQPQPPEPEEPS